MIRFPIVLDDIYEKPQLIRNFAIQQKFENNPSANYAGNMTKQGAFSHCITRVVSSVLKEALSPLRNSGRFRSSLKEDMARNLIHTDPHPISFAAVIYLSEPKELLPGTLFFPLKSESVNSAVTSEFNESVVPWRFNRLVAFPSSIPHAPGPSFGTSLCDSRLVQVFFFKQESNDYDCKNSIDRGCYEGFSQCQIGSKYRL